MVRSENLGLGKTHKPKLVASLLKQLAYVPLAPVYLTSKFFLLLPNARGFHTVFLVSLVNGAKRDMFAGL